MTQVHIDSDDLACAFNRLIAQGMDEVLTSQLATAMEKELAPYLGGINDRLDKLIDLLDDSEDIRAECYHKVISALAMAYEIARAGCDKPAIHIIAEVMKGEG